MTREVLIEDEFGDEVEMRFHADGTLELSVLSGNADEARAYSGGFLLNQENVERLHTRLTKFLQGDRDGC